MLDSQALVPRLNLIDSVHEDSVSARYNKSVHKSSPASSRSSSSGISWGTDSEIYRTGSTIRPPYAVYHDKINFDKNDNNVWKTLNNDINRKSPTKNSSTKLQNMQDKALESARIITENTYNRGDETDRYCSFLENNWCEVSLGKPKYTFSIPYGQSNDSLSARITDLSLRDIPGIANLSRLNPRRLALSLSKEGEINSRKSDIRLGFSARILLPEDLSDTPNWSLNTLLGFMFTYDNSWSLYDSHKTSKQIRSFPILNRAVHSCGWGERFGQPYYVVDIFPGSILYVKLSQTSYLPPSLQAILSKCDNLLRILVTNINENDRNHAL